MTGGFVPPANPVPRVYACGFGPRPLQGVQNIRPRAYARAVVWFGANAAVKIDKG